MNSARSSIPDVWVFEPKVYDDERGFVLEAWNQKTFRDAGLNVAFVQDNHSRSHKGVLRGLHYQIVQPQGKLVRVSSGRAFVAAVNLRRGSATFGQSVTQELSSENKLLLWVPEDLHSVFSRSKARRTSFTSVQIFTLRIMNVACFGTIQRLGLRGRYMELTRIWWQGIGMARRLPARTPIREGSHRGCGGTTRPGFANSGTSHSEAHRDDAPRA